MRRADDDAETTVFRPAELVHACTSDEPPTRQVSASELAALLGSRPPTASTPSSAEVTKELAQSVPARTRTAGTSRGARGTHAARTKRRGLFALAALGAAGLVTLAALRMQSQSEPRTETLKAAQKALAEEPDLAPEPTAQVRAGATLGASTEAVPPTEHAPTAVDAATSTHDAPRREARAHSPDAPREPASTPRVARADDVLAAVDALASHDVSGAADRYRALAQARPTEPVFARIAQVLERRLRAHCQARLEAGEPPCTTTD